MILFAPCPRGLEPPLAAELTGLGAHILEQVPGGISFEAADMPAEESAALRHAWALVYRVNLWSRLASRVLIQLDQAPYRKEKDLYALAFEQPWEAIMHPGQTLRIDTSATRSPLKSLNFANLLIKDAICDRLRQHLGDRPSIDTEQPDVRVFLFLDAFKATLYVDSSGENLFKRGWRQSDDKGEAPIKENLAAGLIALSGWQGAQPFADLFCGSGTIAIEAAQQALDIAPGLQRDFGFQRLGDFDEALWQQERETALARASAGRLRAPIQASDIDPGMIALARANAQRAGLPREAITWSVCAAEQARPLASAAGNGGFIISNPPYGERMGPSFDPVALGNNLRQAWAGWQAWIITSDRDLPGQIRLRESRKIPLFNGTLECRLFCFQMKALPTPGAVAKT